MATLLRGYSLGVRRERRFNSDGTLSNVVTQQRQHTESLTALQCGQEAQGAQLSNLDGKVDSVQRDVGRLQTTDDRTAKERLSEHWRLSAEYKDCFFGQFTPAMSERVIVSIAC